jgi:oligopeptide/dipeptide ABC transporter ATP-binding protein
MTEEIAVLNGLHKTFRVRGGHVQALDGVDLTIHAGESVGRVGESGSGKSTLARILMGLDRPTSGAVQMWGHDLTAITKHERPALRRKLGVVFQDPFSSLNPKLSLGRIITEPMEIHRVGTRASRAERASELLDAVGIDPAWRGRKASQLSGGQRQRVAIARAIALEPELLILDEPVSGLDVSVQAQVLNVLADLRDRLRFASLIISHDLAVVRHVADRITVLYLGRVVEDAPADDLFRDSQHPYTMALLSSAMDDVGEAGTGRIVLTGDPPSPIDVPTGCRFRTRCFRASGQCAVTDPPLREIQGTGHQVACLFPGSSPPPVPSLSPADLSTAQWASDPSAAAPAPSMTPEGGPR